MKPFDRETWLMKRIAEEPGGSVDVLNADFVSDYIEATNATHRVTMYGAYKCPQLGADLARMAKAYQLRRSRCGLTGMAGMGFPRWVWSYRVRERW